MGYISDLQMSAADGALYVLVLLGAGDVQQGLHRIVNTIPADAVVESGRMAARAVPNPAPVGRGVTIRLQRASADAQATLRIFDAAGRWVRTLQGGAAPPGQWFWDGRDALGASVAPGLYMYESRTAAGGETRGKVSLVR
jgi:flagellar hook assembly protein FlgD